MAFHFHPSLPYLQTSYHSFCIVIVFLYNPSIPSWSTPLPSIATPLIPFTFCFFHSVPSVHPISFSSTHPSSPTLAEMGIDILHPTLRTINPNPTCPHRSSPHTYCKGTETDVNMQKQLANMIIAHHSNFFGIITKCV